MTRGYKRLQEAKRSHKKLQEVYRGLKGAKRGYKRFIMSDKRLQGPTGV